MRRVARYGGFGLFLVGSGLQLAGWTSPVVGVSLMVLGAAWVIGVFVGPPVADRALDAVATDVAKRLQVGIDASKAAQETDRKRVLQGMVKRMIAELTVASERLEEARARGLYWDSEVFRLSSDEWVASHEVVSDDPELASSYMHVRLAYEELNRINGIVIERRNHPVVSSRQTDPSDRLPDATDRVYEGIFRLQELSPSL
jgi:hypothetical protein